MTHSDNARACKRNTTLAQWSESIAADMEARARALTALDQREIDRLLDRAAFYRRMAKLHRSEAA